MKGNKIFSVRLDNELFKITKNKGGSKFIRELISRNLNDELILNELITNVISQISNDLDYEYVVNELFNFFKYRGEVYQIALFNSKWNELQEQEALENEKIKLIENFINFILANYIFDIEIIKQIYEDLKKI